MDDEQLRRLLNEVSMAASVGSTNDVANPYNHTGALSPATTTISTVMDLRDGGSSAHNSSTADSPTSAKAEGMPQYRNKMPPTAHTFSTGSNASANTTPSTRMHHIQPSAASNALNLSNASSPSDAVKPPPYFSSASPATASNASPASAGAPTPPPYANGAVPTSAMLTEGDVMALEKSPEMAAVANVSSLISRGQSAHHPSQHLTASAYHPPHYNPQQAKGVSPNGGTPSLAPASSHMPVMMATPNPMSGANQLNNTANNNNNNNIVEPIIVRNANGVYLLTPLSQLQSSQIIASMQMNQQMVNGSASLTPHMTPHAGPASVVGASAGKDQRLGGFQGSYNNLHGASTAASSSRQSPMATGMPPPYAGAYGGGVAKGEGSSPIPTCPLPPPASPFLGYAMGATNTSTGTPQVNAAVPTTAVTPMGGPSSANKAPPRYPGGSPYPAAATPSYSPAAYPTVPNNSIIMAGGMSFGLPPPAYAGAASGGVATTTSAGYSPPAYGGAKFMPPTYDGR